MYGTYYQGSAVKQTHSSESRPCDSWLSYVRQRDQPQTLGVGQPYSNARIRSATAWPLALGKMSRNFTFGERTNDGVSLCVSYGVSVQEYGTGAD